jgi:hypothetical protein
MTDTQGIESAIERLGAQNRRMKWLLSLLSLLFALLVAWVYLQIGRQKNTMEVQELLLKDRLGQVVARLGTSPAGTCLDLLGKKKVATAEICVADETGSVLSLINDRGDSRALLTAGVRLFESMRESLPPGLTISKANGTYLIDASLGPETKLTVGGGAEHSAVVLSVPRDKPSITVLNSDGKARWTAP